MTSSLLQRLMAILLTLKSALNAPPEKLWHQREFIEVLHHQSKGELHVDAALLGLVVSR